MTGDHFLREYLKEGLSDVVSIGREEHEEESGSCPHVISETVVARKRDGFFKVSASSHTNRYTASRLGIDSREPISAGEYASLAADKPIIDTPEARARIAHQGGINLLRQKLREKLLSLAPKCPKCGTVMEMKPGKNGLFWGCPGYPSCRGKPKSLSTPVRAILKELDSLKE